MAVFVHKVSCKDYSYCQTHSSNLLFHAVTNQAEKVTQKPVDTNNNV